MNLKLKQIKNGKRITSAFEKMETIQSYKAYLLCDLIDTSNNQKAQNYLLTPSLLLSITVKCSHRPSTYGYQYQSSIHVNHNGTHYYAMGSKTGGCGYDKISTSISDAFMSAGIDCDYFGGTGEHEKYIYELSSLLANGLPFIVLK